MNPLLGRPAPDFAALARVLKGEEEPRRVRLVELVIDSEVLQEICERYLGQPWIPYRGSPVWLPSPEGPQEPFFRQLVNLYYRLGYDLVRTWPIWVGHPPVRRRRAPDTAPLPHPERAWVDESQGLISSWDDFHRFPWDGIVADCSPCTLMARHLPAGMKLAATSNLFEHVMSNILGTEGLFYLLYDEPELVEQVFERWGQKVYDYYAAVIGMEEVGAIWHGDDLGFNTSTMLSAEVLRRLVLPWFKRYATLAHEHGKMFWLHCCGNIYGGLIEDLIDDVQVDALHSFQDVILPVVEFKARYGGRIAALGGVDMDKLARLDEPALRAYLREILARCMPGGRFALGSGNTVANYVPLANYLAMLDQARRWPGS